MSRGPTKRDYVLEASPTDHPESIRKILIAAYDELVWLREDYDRATSREDDDEAKEARRRERQEQLEAAATAELQRARAQAIRAIAKLLPEAVKQAKAKPPRPALLRMILRATR
jgi:hypothetical protein